MASPALRSGSDVPLALGLFALALAACGCGSTTPAQTQPAAQPVAPPAEPTPPVDDPPAAGPQGGVVTATLTQPLTPSAETAAPPTDAPPVPEEDVTGDEEPAAESLEAILEQALESCESAQEFWREGNLEDALAALDSAYSLMLSVPTNGDAVRNQQKEDLRRLISRRIVEIYASQQTAVGDLSLDIPLVTNSYVEAEIRSFQGPERSFFMESYQRSGRYRPMILEELRAVGMPEQLSWLPLIESGYKVRALSTARALGLWQFISSTGYRFGLRRDKWVDERMDPVKATRAAIAYLTELHGLFGDWLTAIAAYNCGENQVARRINNQRLNYLDQFWDLYEVLPRETARYVPRFLATLLIMQDPAKYGFQLPTPDAPVPQETIQVTRSVKLDDLDRALDLAQGTLKELNPELRHGATPQGGYDLKVPTAKGEAVLASLTSLPAFSPPVEEQYGVHRVRRGDTLSQIASRYHTTVDKLRRLNNLRNANRLSIGQRIRIPQRGGAAPEETSQAAATGTSAGASAAPTGTPVTYTVRRGDTLWRVASRHGTTAEQIRKDNTLEGDQLHVGQELRITPGAVAPPPSGGYVVRQGDTLASIAREHQVSLDSLLRANDLTTRSVIYPKQRLAIP